jgi:hypothetical protein
MCCCPRAWFFVPIDIDPFSEEGWKFVEESLLSLCKNGGAKLIRLDAFGYVTKKAGTGCFMEVGHGCTCQQESLLCTTGCQVH